MCNLLQFIMIECSSRRKLKDDREFLLLEAVQSRYEIQAEKVELQMRLKVFEFIYLFITSSDRMHQQIHIRVK